MLLTVLRKYGNKSTIGRLLINGEHFCYTAELPKGQCIPEGDYPIVLTQSPRFRRIMPRLVNVPMHEGILIHVGNFIPKDSQGCLLVGFDKGEDCVLRSKLAFDSLFNALTEAAKTQILAIEIREDKDGKENKVSMASGGA